MSFQTCYLPDAPRQRSALHTSVIPAPSPLQGSQAPLGPAAAAAASARITLTQARAEGALPHPDSAAKQSTRCELFAIRQHAGHADGSILRDQAAYPSGRQLLAKHRPVLGLRSAAALQPWQQRQSVQPHVISCGHQWRTLESTHTWSADAGAQH